MITSRTLLLCINGLDCLVDVKDVVSYLFKGYDIVPNSLIEWSD